MMDLLVGGGLSVAGFGMLAWYYSGYRPGGRYNR